MSSNFTSSFTSNIFFLQTWLFLKLIPYCTISSGRSTPVVKPAEREGRNL
uniref:Uncharacterized protein n=1 Tax=Megaselia scalaris TaxID=36166 RepID=T1GM79_MEGSC